MGPGGVCGAWGGTPVAVGGVWGWVGWKPCRCGWGVGLGGVEGPCRWVVSGAGWDGSGGQVWGVKHPTDAAGPKHACLRSRQLASSRRGWVGTPPVKQQQQPQQQGQHCAGRGQGGWQWLKGVCRTASACVMQQAASGDPAQQQQPGGWLGLPLLRPPPLAAAAAGGLSVIFQHCSIAQITNKLPTN